MRAGRLAIEAAHGVEGVVAGHGGRMGIAFTNDAGERLEGVIATVLPDGALGLELHLAAELVPLVPLGEAVREAVRGAATAAGLGDELGPVDVRFEDVLEPFEAEAARAEAAERARAAAAEAQPPPGSGRA